jgi:hypothetical protein
MKILRVFLRRTSQTPTDSLVRIGLPSFFDTKLDIDEVHISVIFTWDKVTAEDLKGQWEQYYPGKVKLGGVPYGLKTDEFTAGRYLKKGIVITTRGCNFNCPWCHVTNFEGKFREINICEGNIIQDNNILLSSKSHLSKVFAMLRTQSQIRFLGGIDVRVLNDWHISELQQLRIKELWLALDSEDRIPAFKKAVEKLKAAGFKKHHLRTYVLAGYNEPVEKAEYRLQLAYFLGTLPFVQLYQQDDNYKRMAGEKSRKDNLFIRKWTRPAIYKKFVFIE